MNLRLILYYRVDRKCHRWVWDFGKCLKMFVLMLWSMPWRLGIDSLIVLVTTEMKSRLARDLNDLLTLGRLKEVIFLLFRNYGILFTTLTM